MCDIGNIAKQRPEPEKVAGRSWFQGSAPQLREPLETPTCPMCDNSAIRIAIFAG